MARKLDRRVRRTRALLAEALIKLIMEQGFENLTITDIAEAADLNRATFYLHYGSKEELLIDLLESRFDALVEQIDQINAAQLYSWQTDHSEQVIFHHVAENAEMYKALLGSHAVGYVVNRVINYIAQAVEDEIREAYTDEEVHAPIVLIAQHVAGALFAQISWWLQNDMPYSPAEMARRSHQMCQMGTLKMLGVEKTNQAEPSLA